MHIWLPYRVYPTKVASQIFFLHMTYAQPSTFWNFFPFFQFIINFLLNFCYQYDIVIKKHASRYSFPDRFRNISSIMIVKIKGLSVDFWYRPTLTEIDFIILTDIYFVIHVHVGILNIPDDDSNFMVRSKLTWKSIPPNSSDCWSLILTLSSNRYPHSK